MIIRKIRMVNFRGFRDKTIDFKDKPVVLLSAANGIGKTTTIDAIEWCLTGNIGRLKIAYDIRSTNAKDRKMNMDGILKNRDAGVKEKVRVILWLFDGNKEMIFSREQTKDELKPEISKAMLDKNEERAETFIREYIGESFYNFHFCDVQKSFNVQSKKRKDLKDLFGEFITNYDGQQQVANNLDIFAEDVKRYIEDKEKQKVSQEAIEAYKKQLEKAHEEMGQVSYPMTVFYPGEKIEIIGLNKEELIAQKMKVQQCGYKVAGERLSTIVENEKLKSQKTLIKEIMSYWGTKEASIQRAVKAGFLDNTDAITTLEIKLTKLKRLSLVKDTILREGKSVIALESKEFTQADFDIDKRNIEEKEKKVEILSAEIEFLSKNNKMLSLLSSLAAKKKVMIEYRDTVLQEKDTVCCPVCGSESFASMEESLILKEADDYIRQNGEIVKRKEVDKDSLQTEIDKLYIKIINRAKKVVEKEKEGLQIEINELKILRTEIQPYFDKVKNLQKNRKEIVIEELTAEKVEELLESVEETILEKDQERKIRDTYQQILLVLGYEFENETVQQTYAKIKNHIVETYEVNNFSYDIFVSKLNAIDSILNNQTVADLTEKLEEDKKKNAKIDLEIEELKKLKEIASQRAEDIRHIVEQLSKDEYEKVGPVLSKFYNKLARLILMTESKLFKRMMESH